MFDHKQFPVAARALALTVIYFDIFPRWCLLKSFSLPLFQTREILILKTKG